VSKLRFALMFAFLSSVGIGCIKEHPKHVQLYPMSAAPPSRKVEVINKDERHAITVSSGVAFAINITDDCPKTVDPPTLTIADENVLKSRGLSRGSSTTTWVLWGAKTGKTTVRVQAECATQTYEVNVVPTQ